MIRMGKPWNFQINPTNKARAAVTRDQINERES